MRKTPEITWASVPDDADEDYKKAVDDYNRAVGDYQAADEYHKAITAYESLADEVPFAGDREKAERSSELIAESDKLFRRTFDNLEEQNHELRRFFGGTLPDLFEENGYGPQIANRIGDKFGYGATEVARLSSQRLDTLRTLVEGTFPIGEEEGLGPKKLADLREEYQILSRKKSSALGETLSGTNQAFGQDVQRRLDNVSEAADGLSRAEDKIIFSFLDDPSEETLSRLWQNSSNGIADVSSKTTRAGYALDDFSASIGRRDDFGGSIGSFGRRFNDAYNDTTRSLIDFLRFRADGHFERERSKKVEEVV